MRGHCQRVWFSLNGALQDAGYEVWANRLTPGELEQLTSWLPLLLIIFGSARLRRSELSVPLHNSATDQIRAVPSSLPVASRVPSGLNATAFTLPLWRTSSSFRPLATSQIRAVLS